LGQRVLASVAVADTAAGGPGGGQGNVVHVRLPRPYLKSAAAASAATGSDTVSRGAVACTMLRRRPRHRRAGVRM
jgi:hypothetical protein